MSEKPTNDNPPKAYLSCSDGGYRVIYQGLPACVCAFIEEKGAEE